MTRDQAMLAQVRKLEGDLAEADEVVMATTRRLGELKAELEAITRWAITCAGYLGTRDGSDGRGYWWARGDKGMVLADTAEEAVRRAAGLEDGA